ncbi:MAG: hypothetical protein ACRDIB_03455, partial [Ardenticatenaceae bacterium]
NQGREEASMAVREMLARVKEGMAVLDSTDARIGTVEEVYFGTFSDEAEAYTTVTMGGPDSADINPDIADPFGASQDIPDLLRRWLLTHGYIKIDTGILQSDHFAMADQVAGVSNDTVSLSVPKDELVH